MKEFFTDLLGNLGYGAIVAVIGIFVVFLGLVLIILSIYGISGVLKKIEQLKEKLKDRKAEKAAAAKEEPVAEAVQEPAVIEATPREPVYEESENTDDSELIAVIAAAIAAIDGGSKPFVIRSVRRVAGWKNAARAEQVYKY